MSLPDQEEPHSLIKALPPALKPLTGDEVSELFRVLAEEAPALHRRVKQDVMLQDYEDYRSSALWKRIRKRVLERDKRICLCCGGQGSAVHHRSYARDVMEGRNDAMLATICDGCHDIIHFTDTGERRSEAEVDAVFLAGQRQPTIPPVGKIDLRKPVMHFPGDLKRATSLQLRLFREVFHKAWLEQKAARKQVVEKAALLRAAKPAG